jgi:hypothetical protein
VRRRTWIAGRNGPSHQSGGLRIDQRRSVRKVVKRVRPGSSATSRLYLRLIGSDYGPQMPKSQPLRADQIALIKDWIDQGADWPDEVAGDDPTPHPPDPITTRIVDALRRDDHRSFVKILEANPGLVNHRTVGGATALMYGLCTETCGLSTCCWIEAPIRTSRMTSVRRR